MIAITHRNPELLLVNGTPPTSTPSLRPWRPALYLHFGRSLEALSSTSYRWICQATAVDRKDGTTRFTEIVLRPRFTLPKGADLERANRVLENGKTGLPYDRIAFRPRSSRGRNPRRGIDDRLGQLLRNPAMLSAMLLLGWPRRGWPRTGMRLTGGATSSSAAGCKSKGMGMGPPNIAAPIRAS